jgi:protoporphyrinogen/coproporphyrinogen III oxidase
MNSAPVYVVGAGPSGLAAAWRLQQSGVDVVLLEAGERAGGKINTRVENGFVLERGASILPGAYEHMLRIVDEVGLTPDLEPGGSVVGFAREGRIHYLDSNRLLVDGLTTKLLSWKSKLAAIRLAADNFRIAKLLNYEDLSTAAGYDTETAEGYCRRRLNTEIYDYVVDSVLRGLLGTRGDEVSVLDFFFSINKVIGTKLFSFRGGMSTYVNHLAQKLDVRTGARVREVVEAGDGVRITWEDAAGATHVDDGAGCILAFWGTQVPDVLPGLHPDAAGFLRRLRYTTSVNLNVGLSKPPAGVPAFVVQVPRPTHEGLFGITLEHNKAPGRVPPGKGALGLYTMSDWSEELMDLDDQTVTEQVVAAADQVIPGIAADIEFAWVNRWYPVIVYSRPGLYRELRDFHTVRPRGRITLAGDYFSCSNLNTATAGGERAARELLAVLGDEVR